MTAEFPTTGQKDDFPEACFETNKSIRISDIIFIIVLCVPIFLILLIAIGLGAFAIHSGLSIPLVIGIDLSICILFIRWAWKIIRYRLRFCLIIYSQYLQVGRGLVRCVFPYEDIEKVAIYVRRTRSSIKFIRECSSINVVCGSTKARVFLDYPQSTKCIRLLTHLCINAIIVDNTSVKNTLDSPGKVHLPQNPNNPAKTIAALKRHYKEKIYMNLLIACFMGTMAIWFTIDMINWWIGRIQLNIPEVIQKFIAIIIMYGVIIMYIWFAWKSWKLLSHVRNKIKDIDNTNEYI